MFGSIEKINENVEKLPTRFIPSLQVDTFFIYREVKRYFPTITFT